MNHTINRRIKFNWKNLFALLAVFHCRISLPPSASSIEWTHTIIRSLAALQIFVDRLTLRRTFVQKGWIIKPINYATQCYFMYHQLQLQFSIRPSRPVGRRRWESLTWKFMQWKIRYWYIQCWQNFRSLSVGCLLFMYLWFAEKFMTYPCVLALLLLALAENQITPVSIGGFHIFGRMQATHWTYCLLAGLRGLAVRISRTATTAGLALTYTYCL